MSVLAVLKYVIEIIQNPIYFFLSIFNQHPYTFGSIVVFACLIKLLCMLNYISYTGNEDMTGKTVLITGASTGVGKATAFDLAKRNARVLLACRNVVEGNEVAEEIKRATGNRNVMVECLDLSSFASVRQCAKRILEREDKLHILINNESIEGDPRKVTDDGCEIVMQTNHFSPFLLTLLLLDLLKRSSPSRIINVTFNPIFNCEFDVEDLNNIRGLHQFTVFYNSKFAISLFTRELSERLQETGVTVNSYDPGSLPSENENVMTKITTFLIAYTFEQAAQTAIRLAVDPDLEKTTGKHFYNCTEMIYLSKESTDPKLAKRLFELSERTVGVCF